MGSGKSYKTVGHRGYPQNYPENTLLGFRKAIETGCDALECDVQLNRDGECYVCHDLSLARCAGVDKPICELSAYEISQISAHEPTRFGGKFEPETLPKLTDLVALVQTAPGIHLFVEIKSESFEFFSREQCLETALSCIAPIADRVSLISFDLPLLKILAKRNMDLPSYGWVLNEYDEESLKNAEDLQPDFLIIDKRKIDFEDGLWVGEWQWFVYDVVDPNEAQSLYEHGVTWIESWDVSALK